jgi:DNA-binding CsgD family transcriptional regulator
MKILITQELHDEMAQMREQGMSYVEVARLLGLSRDTIRFEMSGNRKTPYPKGKQEALAILRAALARLEAA